MQKVKNKFLLFFKFLINLIRNHWKLILILLIILMGLVFWQYSKAKKNHVELKFQNPQIENLVKTLEVSGVVDAKEKARLRFAAGGKVTYLGAQEGDEVKKWQTIASIDQATLKKQLQQDLNAYMKERWDWEQTLDDTKDRWLPADEVRTKDKEQWDLENEVIDVEIKDIAIKNSSITAPFTGILTSSPASVTGINLLATDYFEIINPETLVFRATVDEADIDLVKLGQKGLLELDAYEDKIFESQVSYIAYTSNSTSSGTVFIVEFPFPNKSLGEFRIGMNGDISIELEKKNNVMTIPFEATRVRDGKYYVDVKLSKNEYEEREIQIGLETDDKVEVISGLELTDEVLIPE